MRGGAAVEDDFVEGVECWWCNYFSIWRIYSNTEAVAEEDAGCAGWT